MSVWISVSDLLYILVNESALDPVVEAPHEEYSAVFPLLPPLLREVIIVLSYNVTHTLGIGCHTLEILVF